MEHIKNRPVKSEKIQHETNGAHKCQSALWERERKTNSTPSLFTRKANTRIHYTTEQIRAEKMAACIQLCNILNHAIILGWFVLGEKGETGQTLCCLKTTKERDLSSLSMRRKSPGGLFTDGRVGGLIATKLGWVTLLVLPLPFSQPQLPFPNQISPPPPAQPH